MTSNISKLGECKDNLDDKKEEEASIYTDACSNSLEIDELVKKEKKPEEKLIEKNDNDSKTVNQNDSNSFSLSDINTKNRRGSLMSFNSTKSTLYIKKNCNNLKKIKINFPQKNYYLNNKYNTNNSQILSPIQERFGGNKDLLLPVFSAENKKQNYNSEEKDFFILRQSLEPKNDKFIFSPNININQNYFNFKNSVNLNIKKKIFSSKKDKTIIDSDNEDNKDININAFINTKRSKQKRNGNSKDKKDKKEKATSSFKLIPDNNSILKNSFINSNLEIKKILKIDKIVKISEIQFKGIYKDEINLDFLKQKLRTIPVKTYKKSKSKEKYIKNLIEVQNFFAEKSPIWVIKLSKNYEYLAIGAKNGIIKIFSFFNYNSEDFDFVYNKKNIINYFKFISEKPFLILKKHTKDITDLSWSSFNYELLLSSSVDHYVILWDISKKKGENIIKKFNHNEIVTCLTFSPNDPNIFITGCFDRFIRFFRIDDSIIFKEKNDINNTKLNESKSTININMNHYNLNSNMYNNNTEEQNENKFEMPYYFNIKEIITSVAFFPDGSKLAIGTHNGKILVYNINNNIGYEYCFNCRNKLGKFSSGRKINGINFIDKNRALITTSDSRIRLIYMNNGKIIHKYKGNQNINSMIKCSCDFINDVLICGSEDNFCYIWNIFNMNEKNVVKNYKYEYFKPFAVENIYCSLIAPEICYTNYIKKIYKLTNKINIISVIINATDNGRLEILLNVDEN
mgnify:FL=1